MFILLILLLAIAVLAWYRRPDLRREMLWAGILASPLVVLEYAVVDWSAPFDLIVALMRLVTIALFAAVAAVLYEILFRRVLVPTVRPDRSQLWWLCTGPAVFVLGVLIGHWPWLIALVVGLFAEAIIISIRRHDVLWDLVVSAGGMAVLYAVAWVITGQVGGGDVTSLLFHDRVIGITFFGFPIEGFLAALLFGAVWGPLYAVAKHRGETRMVSSPAHRRTRMVLAIIILIVTGGGTAWGATQFALPPALQTMTPNNGSRVASWADPVKIQFTAPVHRDAVSLAIEPEVAGTWTFTDPAYGERAYRAIVFTPETVFLPETKYTLHLRNVESLAGTGRRDYTVTFTTASLPTLASNAWPTGPIEPCQPLTLPLSGKIPPGVTFAVQTEPAIDIVTSIIQQPPSLQLLAKDCFHHATSYTISLSRTVQATSKVTQAMVDVDETKIDTQTVVTTDPPTLVTLTPSGTNIPVGTTEIRLAFGRPMPSSASDAITISPQPTGAWAWENSQTLTYHLTTALLPETVYTMTIPAGIKDAVGGFFPEAVSQSFTTIGAVSASVSPANKATGVKKDAVLTLSWNQGVDHAQAEAAVKIAPTTNGSFSWNGNRLNFHPEEGWAVDTSYTVTVAAGVTSAEGGLPSAKELTSSFATETTKVILNIAVDYQDKPLSCEAAALKMALAGKGVRVSESDIMAIVGYDTTGARGKTWGDPDRGFVGNISGHQNTTGYGVHWQPIARAAQHWRTASSFSNWTTTQLAAAIADGNPVVIWGVLGHSYSDPWKTPSGKTVNAWKGEHARTVVGFWGPVDAPTHFIINDPIVGRVTWTAAALRANWGAFNNSGVVVQ